MLFRRIFFRWIQAATVVLPIWLAVGWAVFGGGGWGTLGLIITVPVTFISLAVIALLTSMRPSVREQRAVSWGDVGVLGAWHLAIIGFGFSGPSMASFAFLSIALALAAFWYAIVQLVRDGARRMQQTMADYERAAQAGTPIGRPDAQGGPSAPQAPYDIGEVIVVEEHRDRP
ncbi:hypothetical protein BJ978_002895 [Agromyces terreus]|uniref:Uncharacterized protein n=1 Tax=Agromyces terreus TaxID=424795 RepID=A0A9X2KD21_9MICO|nr:hypothetical protein [Agromyces terreus]MCP2372219.1 hypothetical protein [Agromyces terreus]